MKYNPKELDKILSEDERDEEAMDRKLAKEQQEQKHKKTLARERRKADKEKRD